MKSDKKKITMDSIGVVTDRGKNQGDQIMGMQKVHQRQQLPRVLLRSANWKGGKERGEKKQGIQTSSLGISIEKNP